jgi:pimeloyl-ACP methyl ester carboxylesterase
MSMQSYNTAALKPAPYTDRYVRVGGLNLHVQDYGTAGKPQMLCVHGSAAHAHWFDFVASGLTDEYHVLALDQRGHGDSEWDLSPHPEYNYDRYAADLHELSEKLGLRDFILIGHSMGGLVSTVYAATYPGRARAFIMVDSTLDMPAERIASMNAVGSREGSSYANAAEFLANYKIRPSGSSATPDMVRHLGLHSGRQFEDGRWRNKDDRNVYARRVGRNLIPYWAHIKIPALLMRGDRSNRISPQIIAQVRAHAPQVQVAEVAGCDHHVTLDNPPGFVEVCKQWIASID